MHTNEHEQARFVLPMSSLRFTTSYRSQAPFSPALRPSLQHSLPPPIPPPPPEDDWCLRGSRDTRQARLRTTREVEANLGQRCPLTARAACRHVNAPSLRPRQGHQRLLFHTLPWPFTRYCSSFTETCLYNFPSGDVFLMLDVSSNISRAPVAQRPDSARTISDTSSAVKFRSLNLNCHCG